MAMKIMRSMKPWAGTYEDPTRKPFWAVVAIGRTGIRGVIIITVGAFRSDADVDGNLRLCFGSSHGETDAYNGGQSHI